MQYANEIPQNTKSDLFLKEGDMPFFINSANKHLDRMADIPKYVSLNNMLDRNNFVNGTSLAWNQYIPYCSFCTSAT